MKFSVLIPLYVKNNVNEFKKSLRSIWDEQTLRPDEIVIVKDGPLPPDLDQYLAEEAKRCPIVFAALEKAGGLGSALNEGLLHCRNEIVARMDGDDIALSDRFERQIAYMEQHPEVGILGGQIEEFCKSPDEPTGKRVVPLTHPEIMKFIRYRNPFNHMTVCFRKSLILQNGNYKLLPGYEDYWLWARCLSSGVIGANLPDVLVKARTGEMVKRRKGLKILKADFKLSRELHRLSFLSFSGMVRNMILRFLILSLPASLLKVIYKTFLRK